MPLRSVLQIEDNPANAQLVEELIARRSDLKLLTAPNGKQGVELAQLHLPDVILMDINLPDMSGVAALTLLRDHQATSRIPIIALSSNAYLRQISDGLDAGFCMYLTKPYFLADLMDAIDTALGKQ